MSRFATRAFRRPVDSNTVERLADLAESVYADGKNTFEAGVAKSMTAVLASPRFLFREEVSIEDSSSQYPLLDEYALRIKALLFPLVIYAG